MQIIDVGDPNWWLSIKFVDCSPPASVSTVFFSKAVAIQRRSRPMCCATVMLSLCKYRSCLVSYASSSVRIA